MNYSRSLDGLRGLAILLVLFFHYEYIIGFGWVGVQLFFVLSGYLITSLLLKEKENPLGFYLKRFYWRRTLRIFPIYYAYLAFVAAVYLLKGLPADFPQLIPYLATYTFNFYPLIGEYSYADLFFTHFWSLSVEEQFYLMWPLLVFFCNRQQLKYILLTIIIGTPFIRYFLAEWMLNNGHDVHYTGQTVYRFTFSQWDGFAFGALIPVFSLKNSTIRAGWWYVATAAVIVLLGIWTRYDLVGQGLDSPWSALGYQIGQLENFQHVWSFTLWDFSFFLLALYIVQNADNASSMVTGLFSSPVMVFVGKISYGLYVYHWIVMMALNGTMRPWLGNDLLAFLAYLTITFAVSTASFYLIERRILAFKDRLYLKPS